MKTFREQFDKLVKAYMSDEVKPLNPCACFVGNLLNHSSAWANLRYVANDGFNFIFVRKSCSAITKYHTERSIRINSDGTYTVKEIYKLEKLFMNTWHDGGRTEDSLFEAFEKTLLLLREIHESKGEVVEDYSFTKRELV